MVHDKMPRKTGDETFGDNLRSSRVDAEWEVGSIPPSTSQAKGCSPAMCLACSKACKAEPLFRD
jgi:hypothetical protein